MLVCCLCLSRLLFPKLVLFDANISVQLPKSQKTASKAYRYVFSQYTKSDEYRMCRRSILSHFEPWFLSLKQTTNTMIEQQNVRDMTRFWSVGAFTQLGARHQCQCPVASICWAAVQRCWTVNREARSLSASCLITRPASQLHDMLLQI